MLFNVDSPPRHSCYFNGQAEKSRRRRPCCLSFLRLALLLKKVCITTSPSIAEQLQLKTGFRHAFIIVEKNGSSFVIFRLQSTSSPSLFIKAIAHFLFYSFSCPIFLPFTILYHPWLQAALLLLSRRK